MTKQDLEQKLENLYKELGRFARQMDDKGITQTRQEILQLERDMDKINR